jgi:hypothetical protein
LSELKIILIVDADTRNASRTRRRVRETFPQIWKQWACIVSLSTAEEAIPFVRALPHASYFLVLDQDQNCRFEFGEKKVGTKNLEFADGIWLGHYIRNIMHAKVYQLIVFTRDGLELEYQGRDSFLFVKGSVTDPKNWPMIHAFLTTFLAESNPLPLNEQAPLI